MSFSRALVWVVTGARDGVAHVSAETLRPVTHFPVETAGLRIGDALTSGYYCRSTGTAYALVKEVRPPPARARNRGITPALPYLSLRAGGGVQLWHRESGGSVCGRCCI